MKAQIERRTMPTPSTTKPAADKAGRRVSKVSSIAKVLESDPSARKSANRSGRSWREPMKPIASAVKAGVEIGFVFMKDKIEEKTNMSMTKISCSENYCIPLDDPAYPPHSEYPQKKPRPQ